MQIVTPMPDPCQKHPAVVLRTCFVSHQLYETISNLQSWLYNVWQRLFSPHLIKYCNKSSGRQFPPPTYHETYAGPKITPKTHINIFHLLLSLFVEILKSVCFSFDWVPKLIQKNFKPWSKNQFNVVRLRWCGCLQGLITLLQPFSLKESCTNRT